jgi:magnesium chelatase family protein
LSDDVFDLDYKDVLGQEFAKRALLVAMSGNHNILFIGTPGVGKSMMAKRIPGIIGKLSYEESIENAKILSLIDKNGVDVIKTKKRPFRTPHHSITKTALIGGGAKILPGEITLSHNGVLFLDEILEFNKDSLDFLREPLEEKKINITRVNGSITYPADFMLVAAMNPCKCGYYGSKTKKCICRDYQVKNYLKKISGPILDRIPILIKMNEIDNHTIKERNGMSTEEMAYIINKTKKIQEKRYKKTLIKCNDDLSDSDIEKYCNFNNSALKALDDGFKKFGFSMRSYNNVRKVSRTIADIDESDDILEVHVLEALQFRKMEKYIMG